MITSLTLPSLRRAGGYDETKCDQPWTVPLTLKLLVTVPPIIFILIGLFCLHHYPLSEESVERTRKQLELRRCVVVFLVCLFVCLFVFFKYGGTTL